MYSEDDFRTRHYKTIYVISLVNCLFVYRLAIRLPPYLLLSDVLDAVPPLYSIKPVVAFINSNLVSITTCMNGIQLEKLCVISKINMNAFSACVECYLCRI